MQLSFDDNSTQEITLENRTTDMDVYEEYSIQPVLSSTVGISGVNTYWGGTSGGFAEVQLWAYYGKIHCIHKFTEYMSCQLFVFSIDISQLNKYFGGKYYFCFSCFFFNKTGTKHESLKNFVPSKPLL